MISYHGCRSYCNIFYLYFRIFYFYAIFKINVCVIDICINNEIFLKIGNFCKCNFNVLFIFFEFLFVFFGVSCENYIGMMLILPIFLIPLYMLILLNAAF